MLSAPVLQSDAGGHFFECAHSTQRRADSNLILRKSSEETRLSKMELTVPELVL
jgi:hypothetical protein